jgi:hypothetical protein
MGLPYVFELFSVMDLRLASVVGASKLFSAVQMKF